MGAFDDIIDAIPESSGGTPFDARIATSRRSSVVTEGDHVDEPYIRRFLSSLRLDLSKHTKILLELGIYNAIRLGDMRQYTKEENEQWFTGKCASVIPAYELRVLLDGVHN